MTIATPEAKTSGCGSRLKHQPVVLAKSEEASRMHRDATPFEKPDRQCLSLA